MQHTITDKPVGWIMLHHRCTREEAEAMLPYCNDPLRLVLPPVIDRHEVNSYEWSAIASKVESLRRADRDEKVLQERLARRNKREHPDVLGVGVTEPGDVDEPETSYIDDGFKSPILSELSFRRALNINKLHNLNYVPNGYVKPVSHDLSDAITRYMSCIKNQPPTQD